jgi:imidazolonepropionase
MAPATAWEPIPLKSEPATLRRGCTGAARADLLIADAALALTAVPAPGDPIGRIPGASVAIAGERILAVGPAAEVASQVDATSARVIDATGKIVAPGFVDSHTHLVFAGSRAAEYAARMTHSAAEVAAMGIPMGIQATVAATRSAPAEALVAGARQRLRGMLRHGTTTVETKSGYGLTPEAELKMLRVNRDLGARQPVDIVSTFLGAHDFPPELPRDRYVAQLIAEMIPRVAEEGLAEFCDVYCDEGYYTVEESRRILEAGRIAGLKPKIHTDAYSAIGGAAMAAELGVVSADHLNYAVREDFRKLAAAGVTGVVMPALDWAVAHSRPFDARAMLSEGLPLALATDLCPACWVESMQVVMQLACRLYRLSPDEALFAATAGGARALGLEDRGTLQPGRVADIQIWDLPSFEDVIYRIGSNAVETVIKRGRIVVAQGERLTISD